MLLNDISKKNLPVDAELAKFMDRLRNETRKVMLLFIAERPRRYQELAEYTQLKPGSLIT